MKQPNRKRKLSMDSKEHFNQDGCLEQAEEEKRPTDGAAHLSHGYPDPENFSWKEYLEAAHTSAIPVFKMRLPHDFLSNMKLEVVDKRNPRLIRVAMIVCVYDQRIKVAEFVQSLLGCEEHAKCFKKEQIDGKAFLLLTQRDIIKVMKIKLGPALKIYNSILMFKDSKDLTEEVTVSGQEVRD